MAPVVATFVGFDDAIRAAGARAELTGRILRAQAMQEAVFVPLCRVAPEVFNPEAERSVFVAPPTADNARADDQYLHALSLVPLS